MGTMRIPRPLLWFLAGFVTAILLLVALVFIIPESYFDESSYQYEFQELEDDFLNEFSDYGIL